MIPQGKMSDVRMATIIFYIVASAICATELLKTTKATFRKKYTILRFCSYVILLIHSVFGCLCSLWIANSTYSHETFAFLVISCTANVIYQTLTLYVLLVKLNTVASSHPKISKVNAVIKFVIVFKSILSGVSMIVMYYLELTMGVSQYYAVGIRLPIMLASSLANLVGNTVYILLLAGVQAFFVQNVNKHIKLRTKSISSQHQADNASVISNRQQVFAMVICFIGIIIMVFSMLKVMAHSIGLSFLAFVSAQILKLFDEIDQSAIGAISGTGGGNNQAIKSQTESMISKQNASTLHKKTITNEKPSGDAPTSPRKEPAI